MLKNQKGITLIALIITIIVMLILVGVTINVALNGGLFQKADTAAKQTQLEADKEILYLEAIAVYNEKEGTLDTEKLKTNLGAMKWTVNSDGNPFICTSRKENQLKITLENGDIKIEEYDEEDNKDNTEDEPSETVYSFTLNELGTYTKDTGDSAFYFNLSNVWSAVGADLSQNSDYYYQATEDSEIFFIFDSNDDKFNDGMGINLGIFSIEENNQYATMSYIDGEYLWVKVVGLTGQDLLVKSPSEGQMTHEEFMQLYGNVEFSFVKISDYIQEVE